MWDLDRDAGTEVKEARLELLPQDPHDIYRAVIMYQFRSTKDGSFLNYTPGTSSGCYFRGQPFWHGSFKPNVLFRSLAFAQRLNQSSPCGTALSSCPITQVTLPAPMPCKNPALTSPLDAGSFPRVRSRFRKKRAFPKYFLNEPGSPPPGTQRNSPNRYAIGSTGKSRASIPEIAVQAAVTVPARSRFHPEFYCFKISPRGS